MATVRRRDGNAALVRRLLAAGGRAHFIGICGVGMAGAAALLRSRGFSVSGCDLDTSSHGRWLRARGIRVFHGHGARHLRGADWAVRTSAAGPEHPEVSAAGRLGIPVIRRGELLARMIECAESVAVAGTHGKTTTAGAIVQFMRACGAAPSFCIGGKVPSLGGVAGSGKSGIVVEADESDGTLDLYRPDVAVVTNIEADHLDHFKDISALKECFRRFVAGARKGTIYCGDDPAAAEVCAGLTGSIGYGFSPRAAVRAVDVELLPGGSRFAVTVNGRSELRCRLPVPGRHNILNALAAISVCLRNRPDMRRLKEAVSRMSLPMRRFDVLCRTRRRIVISDYAHHPSEVKATMAAALGLGFGGVRAVFQPHRYSRTAALGRAFPPAFAGAGEVLLLPVYAASERPVRGGSIFEFYAEWRKQSLRRKEGSVPSRVFLASSQDAVLDYFAASKERRETILVAGAGDVVELARRTGRFFRRAGAGSGTSGTRAGDSAEGRARRLRAALRGSDVRVGELLSRRTTLRVGGAADIWVEIGTLADLRAVMRWCRCEGLPFGMVGAGSNLLAADIGVRGVTARLAGSEFGGLSECGGIVRAGAGVPLARLSAWLERNGFGGLEFLQGIPGTVGGAVRTNAGAFGADIGSSVECVRCLDSAGVERVVRKPEFGYRSGVRAAAITEASFRVSRAAPRLIRERRAEIARKRGWMAGLRCAGSVFKNPAGDFAGRLIEQCGLKGRRIGGAVVSRRHANVIVAVEGATASDVFALMEIARSAVKERFGVELENEIEILGQSVPVVEG